ncbi:MAG: hypothetical protein ABSA59_22695 [Terriglobia bacterium]
MRTSARTLIIIVGAVFTLLVLGGGNAGRLDAKEKASQISSNDPTVRLYNLLDSKYNGKLDDFFLLADVVNDSKNPGQPQQHVLRVEYNKDRAFGKLNLHVRTVAQLSPEQLKTYSPKQIYDFAESDSAKFTKTDPGPFGKPGDVYFEPFSDGGAMGTVPVTPEVQAQYERFVTQHLLPALEKKAAGGNGS